LKQAALKQRLHDRAVRCLDGDVDLTRLASAGFQQPGDHLGEASAPMRDLALSNFPAPVIEERNQAHLGDSPRQVAAHKLKRHLREPPRRRTFQSKSK
jgi:hypothetical protein